MSELQTKETKVNPDRVTFSLGFTRNLGNWQSCKINVGLTRDAADDAEQTYREIKATVEGWFAEAMEEMDEDMKELSKKKQ